MDKNFTWTQGWNRDRGALYPLRHCILVDPDSVLGTLDVRDLPVGRYRLLCSFPQFDSSPPLMERDHHRTRWMLLHLIHLSQCPTHYHISVSAENDPSHKSYCTIWSMDVLYGGSFTFMHVQTVHRDRSITLLTTGLIITAFYHRWAFMTRSASLVFIHNRGFVGRTHLSE